MHRHTQLLAGAASLVFGLPALFGGTLNLSTGLDSGGSLITTDLGCDAHWVQVAGPTAACANSAAQVVMSSDAGWFGGWIANGPNSNWITSNASTTANGSPLPGYSVTFFLDNTSGASLSGSWTIDDQGAISLNGNPIGSLGGGNWGSLSSVSASSGFAVGANTLRIAMSSSDNFLEGVRFEGSVTGPGASLSPSHPAVPEPISGWMFVAGMGVLFAYRRHRQA